MIEAYIRQLFAELTESEYDNAHYIVQRLLTILEKVLSSGIDPNSPFLGYYYNVKIMAKKVLRRLDNKGKYWYMFKEIYQGEEHNPIQILILDTRRKKILVQRRGPFKRLFPSKYTVSTNTSLRSGQYFDETVKRAIKKEVDDNLAISPSRMQRIGREKEFSSYLASYDFYAVTDLEAQKLREVYERMKPENSIDGIMADYSEAKRSLCVLGIDPEIGREQILRIAEKIKSETQIPFMYPVLARNRNTLIVYQLEDDEQKLVDSARQKKLEKKKIAWRRLEKPMSARDLDMCTRFIDSDDMEFISCEELVDDFKKNPLNYALDLIGHYLSNEEIWSEICK